MGMRLLFGRGYEMTGMLSGSQVLIAMAAVALPMLVVDLLVGGAAAAGVCAAGDRRHVPASMRVPRLHPGASEPQSGDTGPRVTGV